MNIIFIIPLAIIGFTVSFYIFYKKQRNEKLVCIIGNDCNKVVYSKYNNVFFGIPNEIVGMLYYFSAAIFTIIILYFGINSKISLILIFLLTLAALASTIFSVIMTYIQLAIIKEWCEYCLISSMASILIFAMLAFHYF